MSHDISQSSAPPTSVPVPHEEFGKGWRWLTVVAGLALAATFFMPFTGQQSYIPRAVGPNTFSGPLAEADSVVDAPYALWGQLIDNLVLTPVNLWTSYVTTLAAFLFMFIIPQFWGLAMAGYSLAQLVGSNRGRRFASWAGIIVSVTLGTVLTVLLIMTLISILKGAAGGISAPIVLHVGIISLILVLLIFIPITYAFLAIRRPDWTYLYHGFIAAFLLVVPLDMMVSLLLGRKHLGLNGATLLVVTGCLLLFARIGEAQAVSRLSWFRTIMGLLFLRLHRWALPPGHCPACGYNLCALTEPRCPECGRPFTPEEANNNLKGKAN